MAENLRRRNRGIQSQPGLLDYIGQGWDAFVDRGMPLFSPNHPGAIASRNIDWENPGDPNDPYRNEQLAIIANSFGGGSNAPGGLLGIIKKVSLSSAGKIKKLKPGEAITADKKVGKSTFILSRNPSKGENYREGGNTGSGVWGTGVDMSIAPKKVAKPEGEYRISSFHPDFGPTGHKAFNTLKQATAELDERNVKNITHVFDDRPPSPVSLIKGIRKPEDVSGLLDLNVSYPRVINRRIDQFRPLKVHPEADEILKIFHSPKQQKLLKEWFEKGVKEGGLEWYNTNPLRKFAIEQFGDDLGLKLYERFIRWNAALSPNTAVPSNIKQASYWNTLDEAGLPIGEQVATRTLGPIPEGYSRMSLAGAKNLLASAQAGTPGPVMLGGKNIKVSGVPKYAQENFQGTFPASAPKVGAFNQNLLGNLMPTTQDAGFMRAIAGKIGGPGKKATKLRESASKEIYATVEDAFSEFAKKLGVEPAKAQAPIWGGSSKYTGIGNPGTGLPPGATWMENLMYRVNKTAIETGQTPKKVLTEVLRGNQYLKSVLMPLLTTGAVGGLLGEANE